MNPHVCACLPCSDLRIDVRVPRDLLGITVELRPGVLFNSTLGIPCYSENSDRGWGHVGSSYTSPHVWSQKDPDGDSMATLIPLPVILPHPT